MEKALIAFVLHEVPSKSKAIKEMGRIIKSGGRLVLFEWEPVETEIGPPLYEKISSDQVSNLLEENGFATKTVHVNQAIYAIIATNKN